METDVLSILKRHVPHKVRVYCGDDDHRDIAIPTRRRKWGTVMDTINRLAWTRLELLQKDGALISVVDNDAMATHATDLGSGGPTSPASINAHLEIMLRAQREALTFRDKETGQLLAGVAEVLKVTVDAMKHTTAMYQAQVAAAADIAAAQAGGDLEQIVKLVEASPKLAPLLGPLIGRLLGVGTAPAPATKRPNGAPAPATTNAG